MRPAPWFPSMPALALWAGGALAPAGAACPEANLLELSASGGALSTGTVTRLDLSWFGLEGSASAPVFYTLAIRNRDTVDHSVRVVVDISGRPLDADLAERCGEPCGIQREMTTDLEVPAGGVLVRTSAQLAQGDFYDGGLEAFHSPFQRLVGRLGYLPSSRVLLHFDLVCSDIPQLALKDPEVAIPEAYRLASADVESVVDGGEPTYVAQQAPELLVPGVPAGEVPPSLPTDRPSFLFRSSLASRAVFYPEGEAKFTVSLWKLRDGEEAVDALERKALASRTTSGALLPYPDDWPALEPGALYTWTVTAHLRGPEGAELVAAPAVFRAPATGGEGEGFGLLASWRTRQALEGLSPEQIRLLQALAVLLGERAGEASDLLSRGRPDLASLRWEGAPTTLERIEELAREKSEGRLELTGVGR